MDIAILLQMSGIINACSTRYEASVPNAQVSYAKQVNGRLVNVKCHSIRIKARGKHKNHLHRSFWVIYELDIDRIIRRISRHNAEMAKRVKEIALTPQDLTSSSAEPPSRAFVCNSFHSHFTFPAMARQSTDITRIIDIVR